MICFYIWNYILPPLMYCDFCPTHLPDNLKKAQLKCEKQDSYFCQLVKETI